VVESTLADPVGTVEDVVSDPVGTVTGIVPLPVGPSPTPLLPRLGK
jgi:hypothetical protein